MNNSSDSEAFESADEDVANTPKHPASSKSASKSHRLKSNDNIIRVPIVDAKKVEPAAATSNKPSGKPIGKSTEKNDEQISEKPVDDGWDDWDDDDDDNGDDKVDDKVDENKKDVPTKPADDGWDNWSDQESDKNSDIDDETSSAISKMNIHSDTTPTKTAEKSIRSSIPLTESVSAVKPPNSADTPATAPTQSSSSFGGWGWGGMVTNLLSTATDGVASITSHVTSAIESGIGVPGPEDMARMHLAERTQQQKSATTESSEETTNSPVDKQQSSLDDDGSSSMLFGQLVSGVANISSRVLTGGLDTLEGIGKKTMAVLQENDPGLRNKRRMLRLDGKAPVLSQILRDAKESAEKSDAQLALDQKHQYKKPLHFETLFDDYHGLVHLEALEMLSRQSALKLDSLKALLAGRALTDLQDTLDEVNELCELPDVDVESDYNVEEHTEAELAQRLATSVEDLDIDIELTDVIDCWKQTLEWMANETNRSDAQQVHDKGLRCLAETTAIAVHKLHKIAELLLIKERHSTANEADALVQLVCTIRWHLGGIANCFGRRLSELRDAGDADRADDLITSTFLEGSNSTSYIRDGFQLFIPILQVGAA